MAELDPPLQYHPALQSPDVEFSPSPSQYIPAGHGMHEEMLFCPINALNVPAGQGKTYG